MRDISIILVIALGAMLTTHADTYGFEPLDPENTEVPAGEAAPDADPQTYDDAEGFDRRSDALIRALATVDLRMYRMG